MLRSLESARGGLRGVVRGVAAHRAGPEGLAEGRLPLVVLGQQAPPLLLEGVQLGLLRPLQRRLLLALLPLLDLLRRALIRLLDLLRREVLGGLALLLRLRRRKRRREAT